MRTPAFGEQRLLRERTSSIERLLFRTLGIADPAHFLHARYFIRTLDGLPELAPRRILDAGCGRGDYSFYLARRFPDAEVLGLDVDERRIARNRDGAERLGLHNARFAVGDLAELPVGAPFDLILAIDVLEHIVRQEAALQRLRQALAPNGVAFFHLPTRRERPVPFSSRLRAFHEWGHEEHVAEERSAEEFIELVRRSGFALHETERTFGYFTGELATSLFALPFRDTTVNRILQALLSPLCRVLALADSLQLEDTRYAVAVVVQPAPVGAPSPVRAPATAPLSLVERSTRRTTAH